MAALSEVDLERIMGADYRNIEKLVQKSKSPDDEYRAIVANIGTQEDKSFSCLVLFLVGIALIVSAHYTAVGNAYTIQMVIAAAFVLGGALWYVLIRQKVGALKQQLANMTPPGVIAA